MTTPEEYLQSPQDEFHLACLLLSPTGVAYLGDALEKVAPEDFFDPHYGRLWEIARKIHAAGQRVTKRALLAEADNPAAKSCLERIAGEPVFTGRIASSIRTVKDTAQMRRLVQRLEAARSYVVTAADYSQALSATYDLLGKLDDGEMPAEVASFSDLVDDFHRSMSGSLSVGETIPTPWWELNEVLSGGLHPGRSFIVAGRPGAGKALSLDTPLPTPSGWTTMGQVQVGDALLGADGVATKVVAATDVMHDRPCYEVEFSDGEVIVADEQHRWLTETRTSRRSRAGQPAVRTTGQIAATLRCGTDQRLNHSIGTCQPLELPERELLLPPYALGVWLGDGWSASASYTSADPEIGVHIEIEGLRVTPHSGLRYLVQLPEPEPIGSRICVVCGAEFIPAMSWVRSCGRTCGGRSRGVSQREPSNCPDCGGPSSGFRRCQKCRNAIGTVQGRLRTLGVLGNKHIPEQYLRASEQQRRDLLAGLLDTDGTVSHGGSVEICVTNRALAEGARELVVSLGYRASMRIKAVKGRAKGSSTAYTVSFATEDDVFRLERKRLVHKERRHPPRYRGRYVVDVRPVPSVPVRCVEVDNGAHLYLAGRSMIPTHNSNAGLNMAAFAAEQGYKTLVVSEEMSGLEVTGRVLSAGARVEYREITQFSLSADSQYAVKEYGERNRAMPLWVVDRPALTIEHIGAIAHNIKRRHGLDLLVIDYMQLLGVTDKRVVREQQVAHISKSVKELSRQLKCAVVTAAQLNRENVKTSRRPTLADLRESGAIEQDADAVILLHHDETADGTPTGMVTLIVAKSRFSAKGDVELRWRGNQARMGD